MIDHKQMSDFFRQQLDIWPDADARFKALTGIRTRTIQFGDFPIIIQYNPARAVSTTAKVDSVSIAKRKCFLCPDARPQEQISLDIDGQYELLVNPFPILPLHFTIPSRQHQNQDNLDPEFAAKLALNCPGYLFFYNGSHSGASAPDHLHLQAGNIDSLPIISYAEKVRGELIAWQDNTEIRALSDLPMNVLHLSASEFTPAMRRWTEALLPTDGYGIPDRTMRNIVWWRGQDEKLHILFFPRAAHRPACYFDEEAPILISPGAIDMCGILIASNKYTFDRLTRSDIIQIYDEVSFRYQDSPIFKSLLLP